MKKSIHSTAELARHLGLSRWSVARAINGQDGISARTAEQVRTAMEKFSFSPSPHARGLRGRRTGAIGVCFRGLNTAVTTEKIVLMQRLLGHRGFRPLCEFAEMDQRMGSAAIRHFIAMRVEAVVLVDIPEGPESAEWQKRLRARGIPVASLEPLGEPAINAVHLDRYAAMLRVTHRLLDLGHTQFGLLGISRNFPLGRPRYEGIVSALEERGLEARNALQIFDRPEHRYGGLNYGHELAEQLLAARNRPTTLLALNDEVAVGAMWALQKAGLQCPRDFSLVGFDNLPLSEQTTPPLSTVDHNVETVAAAAVDLVLRLIELGPKARVPTQRIEPRLVERQSICAR
jgi:DNA-binding LacI/PurR family transcriptional regulator